MNRAKVIRAWIWAGLWLAVIALESFRGSAPNTGSLLRPLVEFFTGRLSDGTFDTLHTIARKCGHFGGYAILSLLLYRAWWATSAARTGMKDLSWRAMRYAWTKRAAVLALLTTLAVAGMDEFHQEFEPDRGPSMKDVALDESGGIVAQAILLALSMPGRKPEEEAVEGPSTS